MHTKKKSLNTYFDIRNENPNLKTNKTIKKKRKRNPNYQVKRVDSLIKYPNKNPNPRKKTTFFNKFPKQNRQSSKTNRVTKSETLL